MSGMRLLAIAVVAACGGKSTPAPVENPVDKPVVVDGHVITARKPDDIPVFSDAIVAALAQA